MGVQEGRWEVANRCRDAEADAQHRDGHLHGTPAGGPIRKRIVLKPKQPTRKIENRNKQKETQESHTVAPAERGRPRKNRVGTRQKLRPGMQKGASPAILVPAAQRPEHRSRSNAATATCRHPSDELRYSVPEPPRGHLPYRQVAAANPEQNATAYPGRRRSFTAPSRDPASVTPGPTPGKLQPHTQGKGQRAPQVPPTPVIATASAEPAAPPQLKTHRP